MLHWVPHGALEESGREHGQNWETWAEDNNAWRTDEAGFAKRAKMRGGGEKAREDKKVDPFEQFKMPLPAFMS